MYLSTPEINTMNLLIMQKLQHAEVKLFPLFFYCISIRAILSQYLRDVFSDFLKSRVISYNIRNIRA